MTIYEKILLIFISLAAFNSVTVSNQLFSGAKIPINAETEKYIEDTLKNEDDLLDFLFPSGEIDEDFMPPFNLTYTISEFQKFKGTYLTETATVDSSYFDDTYFLGDSLTYGLQLGSRLIDPSHTLAIEGYGVYNILDGVIKLTSNSEEKKIIDWLAELKPKKLYINLGTNGVKGFDNVNHISMYSKMIDRIKAVCPDTVFILVAIPPWNSSFGDLNTKINHFNMSLLEYAKNNNMLFLNAAEALMDGSGSLSSNYSYPDGLHWNSTGQNAYMTYLKKHSIY